MRTDARRVAEAVVVVGLVALAVGELRAYDGRTGPLWVHVAAVVVLGLAVLARRRHPLAAVLVGAAAGGMQAAVGFAGSAGELVLVLSLVVVAATLPTPFRQVGLGALGAAFVAVVLRDPDIRTVQAAVPSAVLFTAAAALGALIGRRTAEADRRVRDEAERASRALAEERTSIARELHDVVTHSLSVIVVQAGAARLDAPPAQADAFRVVEDAARTALVEMRRLLGVLRGLPGDDLAPQPGLESLEGLLDQVRSAGVTVDLDVVGSARSLPPGLDVTAYRVLQEALTNVLRHAGAGAVTVTLDWRPDSLCLAVHDDGAAQQGSAAGQGLVGMRERVALYGGTVRAGPRPGGGWSVEARLPLSAEALRADA